MKTLAILVIIALAACAYGDQWAVLVAGSNGYGNYRHQSDVCHAYQILIQHGMDPNKIIVMAYDDIANSRSNPFPGKVFNKPSGSQPGKDVYAGCHINYKGNDVTPKNYLAILQGEKDKVHGGDGKVLTTTSEDTIFLNYSDHGSVGLVAFPAGGYLYADQLLAAFKVMGTKKMYKQIMYYLEACESGSMFVDLPKNVNIYGVSASNPSESSWGCYCYPEDIIENKHIGSCLGDEFSCRWMENSDESDVTTKKIQTQFEEVRKATVKSHVMQWGDTSFVEEVIGTFFGMKKSNGFLGKIMSFYAQKNDIVGFEDNRLADQNYLIRKYQLEPTEANFQEAQTEIFKTYKFNQVFEQFKRNYRLTGNIKGTTNWECYRYGVDLLESKCGQVNTYSLRHFKYIYEFCQRNTLYVANEMNKIKEDFKC